MFEITDHDGVRVLRMAHGKANALDLEFCRALADAFKDEGDRAEPLVITGAGRIFSAGVDLPRLLGGGDAYISEFLRALDDCFAALFGLGKPVVAGINGHAIAGGCIIAAACDTALMVEEGATIGAPELAVGVPFPPLPLEILRHAVGTPVARRLAVGCENLSPRDALQAGLVHRLVSAETLQEAAVKEARRLGAMPRRSFELVKRQLREPATRQVQALKAHAEEVANEWHTAEVKTAVESFIKQTLKRKER